MNVAPALSFRGFVLKGEGEGRGEWRERDRETMNTDGIPVSAH